MRLRVIATGLLLLLATSALAQSPLNDVQFKWGNSQQNGFQRKTTPEIDRYDSLAINVDKQKFLTDAGWAPDGAHRELDLDGTGATTVVLIRTLAVGPGE